MRPKVYWRNEPDSLVDICAKFCVDNLWETLLDSEPYKQPQLRSNVFLPRVISKKLLDMADGATLAHLLPLFQDTTRTQLDTINVQNSLITDEALSQLLEHEPTSLNIHNCPHLTRRVIQRINANSKNLRILTLGSTTPQIMETTGTLSGHFTQLTLWNLPTEVNLCDLFPNCSASILHLDLSGSHCFDPSFLQQASSTLTSLSLFNCPLTTDTLGILGQLTNLKHLDLSQVNELTFVPNPDVALGNLVTSLNNLTSLDLSGTNLAGSEAVGALAERPEIESCILGLKYRMGRPLKFLGLYRTLGNASNRKCIPAKKIAGNSNLRQILIAFQAYMDRPLQLERVLSDLSVLLSKPEVTLCRGEEEIFLDLIFAAMDGRFGRDPRIEMQLCDSLRCLVEETDQLKINPKFRRKILSALVQIMEAHKDNDTIIVIVCDIIRQFQLPGHGVRQLHAESVMTSLGTWHAKLVSLLLSLLTTSQLFVQRTIMYVLSFVTHDMSTREKEAMADLGIISNMFGVIQDELDGLTCYLSETAWPILWNVLDNSPKTCHLFLELGGLDLFYKCINEYSEKGECHQIFMGLAVVGKVVQVNELRRQLTNSNFIGIYYNALTLYSKDLQIAYAASETLVHFASDENWTIDSPTRQNVLDKFCEVVPQWNEHASPAVIYSSFKPLLSILKNTRTLECQLWVTWALSSITKIGGEVERAIKNLEVLEKDGGLEMLRGMEFKDARTAAYAQMTIRNLEQFLESRN